MDSSKDKAPNRGRDDTPEGLKRDPKGPLNKDTGRHPDTDQPETPGMPAGGE